MIFKGGSVFEVVLLGSGDLFEMLLSKASLQI
jgi:hypothetical protein